MSVTQGIEAKELLRVEATKHGKSEILKPIIIRRLCVSSAQEALVSLSLN